MDIICGKTPAYIPTSANEIISAIEIVKKSMRKSLPPKLRIGFLKHDFSATVSGLDKNVLLILRKLLWAFKTFQDFTLIANV